MRKNWKKWMALLTAGTLLVSTPVVFMADDGDGAEVVQSAQIEEAAAEPEAPAAEPAAPAEAPKEEAAPAETPAEAPKEEAAPAEPEAPAEAAQEEAAPAETPADGQEEAAPAETPAGENQSEGGESSAPAESKAEEAPAETPAESKAEEAPAESKAEEAEKKDEAPAESKAEEAESKAEEAEKKEEKPEEKKIEQFTGSVRAAYIGGEELYAGDTVVMRAYVENANRGDYRIVWQAKASSKWVPVAEGVAEYTFAVDEIKAGHTYRAVLMFAENGVNDVASNEIGLPALKVKEEPKADESQMRVSLDSSATSQMTEGETVVLTASISGFDGYEVMYQWSCNKGNGFEVVSTGSESTYSFSATQESLSWDWKVDVYYR